MSEIRFSKKFYTPAEKAAYYRAKQVKRRNPGYSNDQLKRASKYAYQRGKLDLMRAKDIREATKDPGVISGFGKIAGGLVGGLGSSLYSPSLAVPGANIGSFLGGKLGHLIEKVTGFGDYRIESNSILRGGMTPPMVMNSINRGGVILRHREYIGDINATTAFNVTKYPLNPGQEITFPWLSQIAASFEQYRFRGLLFEFLSTSSDAVLSASTSSALGTVNISTDYDAVDSEYPDKRAMLNAEFATSNKPSCTFIHPVECKTSLSPLRMQYIRTGGGFPPNTDARMYDLGNTFVATEGMQAATGVCGELWVTYEVELYKQQYNVNAGLLSDHWSITGATSAAWLAAGAANHVLAGGSTLQGTISDDGTIYTFSSQVAVGEKYYISYWVAGATPTVVANVVPGVFGIQMIQLWSGTSNFVQMPAAGSTSTQVLMNMVVKIIDISGGLPSLTFGTAAIPVGGTVISDFFVMQIPNQLT